MFSFFKKKPVAPAPGEPGAPADPAPADDGKAPAEGGKSAMASLWEVLNKPITLPFGVGSAPTPAPPAEAPPAPATAPEAAPTPTPTATPTPTVARGPLVEPIVAPPAPPAPPAPLAPVAAPIPAPAPVPTVAAPAAKPVAAPAPWRPSPPIAAPVPAPVPAAAVPPPPAFVPDDVELIRPPELEARSNWFGRLKQGLRKTGSGITQVFTGTRIDDALYEELESALLLADTGLPATEYLLADLKKRVKAAKATEPSVVKTLLADALTDLLLPLEKTLTLGETSPTVIMVAGVNGAGKTTSIGKLTKHLAEADCKVLLAAADTFRAAAREQLAVWADRNRVEIVSQEGGDPSAVTFDAVTAGKARGCDVVIADTAGRLPTQVHLMDELKKIHRTIGKAQTGAPHEVLLVVDGNTGQNALSQVKSFDAALGLTGLIVTKLDGTAKGGVLAAIARWGVQQRDGAGGRKGPVPVYFVGIGEKLEDLQTFNAREFAQALVG